MKVDVQEQGVTLLSLIEKAATGEEVIITKDDAMFQIVPKSEPPKASSFPFGCIPGIIIKDHFDDPLPKEMAEAFGIMENQR